MPKHNLTHQFVSGLKATGQTVEYQDTNDYGRGLTLRLLPSGKKRWEYRYRFAGKRKRYVIGGFPDKSLKDARDILSGLKADVKKGIDPQADRERKVQQAEAEQLARASEKTFTMLASDYVGAKLSGLRPATRHEYQRIIDKELLPALGRYAVKDITRGMITRLLDQKAYSHESPVMANRMRSRLHTIFQFGIGRCLEENPVEGTPRYDGEQTGERTYSSEELRQLWDYVSAMTEPFGSYMKILLLTGQRRSETMNMRWRDIRHIEDNDLAGWVWTIPAEQSKSKRAHEVYLSGSALEIIQALKPRAGTNEYVFASFHVNGNPVALSSIKRAVKDIQDNCIADFRLHDMRRTVSTNLARLGVPQPVVEKLLNHKTSSAGPLARVYNRYEYRAERQQAFYRWSQRLHTILTGEPAKIYKMGS